MDDDFDNDTDLSTGLAFDSVTILEAVALLERHYNVEIPEDRLTSFTSVRKIAELVEELRSAKAK